MCARKTLERSSGVDGPHVAVCLRPSGGVRKRAEKVEEEGGSVFFTAARRLDRSVCIQHTSGTTG